MLRSREDKMHVMVRARSVAASVLVAAVALLGGHGSAPRAAAGPQAPSQRPDAELKGLTMLGLVVEELSPQAAACGLRRDAIEAAALKSLTDAGLKVRRNSDEDTYVYVNIITSSLASGLCVSRYDVFLYSYTMATLSHQDTPVLVQVSLLRKGGIAGAAAGTHGDTVVRNVREWIDEFAARIRNANR
jgi:hypothetical protein